MSGFVYSAETRLATYGTLAPGRANHHQLEGLRGRWLTGTVRGRLIEEGWGAAMGYPALILEPQADPVAVHVFESPDLTAHWRRLDGFEGEEYKRVTAAVVLDGGGEVDASIYVLAAVRHSE